MATNLQTLSEQKKLLMRLLTIKNNGVDDPHLNLLIIETKAGLSKEDVAWVENCLNGGN